MYALSYYCTPELSAIMAAETLTCRNSDFDSNSPPGLLEEFRNESKRK